MLQCAGLRISTCGCALTTDCFATRVLHIWCGCDFFIEPGAALDGPRICEGTTALYAQVARDISREVISPVQELGQARLPLGQCAPTNML